MPQTVALIVLVVLLVGAGMSGLGELLKRRDDEWCRLGYAFVLMGEIILALLLIVVVLAAACALLALIGSVVWTASTGGM